MQRKILFKGKTQNRGGGEKNEALIGGGSPHLFCTLPDPANVIFMLCLKINDAVFFLLLCFKYSKLINPSTCVNYSNGRVNLRGAHYVIVILCLLGLGHLTCVFLL